MTTWILYLALANGEAGPVEMSRYVCERLSIAVSLGETVEADVYGERVRVNRAACLGPAVADPCEMEAAS